MHTEFHAFTIAAANQGAALGKLTRWAETRGAATTIVSVTFTEQRDDRSTTAAVVYTDSDNSGIREIPVSGIERGARLPLMPEVLAQLQRVIRDNERGTIVTAALAKQLGGEWDARTLGQALRRAGVPAPRQRKRRVRGYRSPVSVTDLDLIRAAISAHANHTP